MVISRYMERRRTERSACCWSVGVSWWKQRRRRKTSSTFRARTRHLAPALSSHPPPPPPPHLYSTSSSFVHLSSFDIIQSWKKNRKRKSFYFYDYCGLRDRLSVSIGVCSSVLRSYKFKIPIIIVLRLNFHSYCDFNISWVCLSSTQNLLTRVIDVFLLL